MTIIITPLQKAFENLSKALKRALDNPTDLEVRDGCIQRFEYTYELSIKLLKRCVKEESIINDPEQFYFKDLIRIGAEMGFIQEVNAWFAFREARNKTSHVYNEISAKEVFEVIPTFVTHVQFFIEKITNRIQKDDLS